MPENQCGVCHIGLLHARRVTVTQAIDRHLVIVPNVSVWLCDVCGEFAYDADTMKRLYMLLGMPHGAPSSQRRQGALPEDDEDMPMPRFQGRRGA